MSIYPSIEIDILNGVQSTAGNALIKGSIDAIFITKIIHSQIWNASGLSQRRNRLQAVISITFLACIVLVDVKSIQLTLSNYFCPNIQAFWSIDLIYLNLFDFTTWLASYTLVDRIFNIIVSTESLELNLSIQTSVPCDSIYRNFIFAYVG